MTTSVPRKRTRFLTCLLITGFLSLGVGCNPFEHEPELTVHIEISSITEQSERDEVREILKGMTDGSGHVMTTRRDGEILLIKLSPVHDVQSFARGINFGHVTEITGRTVRIEYIKPDRSDPEKKSTKMQI